MVPVKLISKTITIEYVLKMNMVKKKEKEKFLYKEKKNKIEKVGLEECQGIKKKINKKNRANKKKLIYNKPTTSSRQKKNNEKILDVNGKSLSQLILSR